MAVVKSVADWVQVALNAGALVAGGVVWKMYFENLKATIATKNAEVSLAKERTDYWREKHNELEKRSPEVIERVLDQRISIHEKEIERLSSDREHSTQELGRVKEELRLLNQIREQAKGFLAVLEMEAPDANDPNYDEYMEYLKSQADRVVKVEVEYLGIVGVDSGQLMITDPCYIDGQWLDEPFHDVRKYRDTQTGAVITWNPDEIKYTEPLAPYGKTVSALVEAGRLVQLPPPPPPEKFHYSYNGAVHATLSKDGFGELVFGKGHAGAGVVFGTAWGDGFYEIYGEKHDGRIVRVYVNCGAEPLPSPQSMRDGSGPQA
jgi:hypothetical protein